jgi:ZIP family zinc transporter
MATFATLNPILQALLATLFTWGVTALGAASVFVTKTISRRLMDGMLGFAAGVMIAASYWSLLAPAIEMSEGQGVAGWIPAAVGFLLGNVSGWRTNPAHLHLDAGPPRAQDHLKRSVLLNLRSRCFPRAWPRCGIRAVAAGIRFNAAGAIALIGIGLQSFPKASPSYPAA